MDYEQIGVCAVDTGRLCLADPGYLRDPEEYAEFEKQEGDNVSQEAQQLQFKLGHDGLGVIIGSFGGDGCYPVFVKKNANGLVREILVKFN